MIAKTINYPKVVAKPLDAINWASKLPEHLSLAERARISQTVAQLIALIVAERDRIELRRSEAESRWCLYVPDMVLRLRVLEACRVDAQCIELCYQRLIGFYEINRLEFFGKFADREAVVAPELDSSVVNNTSTADEEKQSELRVESSCHLADLPDMKETVIPTTTVEQHEHPQETSKPKLSATETSSNTAANSVFGSVKRAFRHVFHRTNQVSVSPVTVTIRSAFGISLEDLAAASAKNSTNGLPLIVTRSISHLVENALDTPGIFRVSGNAKRMDALRSMWDSATISDKVEDSCFQGYNNHDVAGVLKQFLRDLPEPLLTTRLYRDFLAVDALSTVEAQIPAMRELIRQLPASHHHVLKALLDFLRAVAARAEDGTNDDGEVRVGNKMAAKNLAVCIGPNILREAVKPARKSFFRRKKVNAIVAPTKSQLHDSGIVVKVVTLMIDHAETMF